jgi:hypothetical protein
MSYMFSLQKSLAMCDHLLLTTPDAAKWPVAQTVLRRGKSAITWHARLVVAVAEAEAAVDAAGLYLA